jgi:hypothetical protein
LRDTAVTRLALAECTETEVAAITGLSLLPLGTGKPRENSGGPLLDEKRVIFQWRDPLDVLRKCGIANKRAPIL